MTLLLCLLWVAIAHLYLTCEAFVFRGHRGTHKTVSRKYAFMDTAATSEGGSSPSEGTDLVVNGASKSEVFFPTSEIDQAKLNLLLLASGTERGQNASPLEKERALTYIQRLESSNPTPSPATSAKGTWEVLYSSTQLFRSSPFFMAGRAVCRTEEEAKQYDWFCDMHRAALAISSIGKVRQIISDTQIISEFEVKVGSVPFLSDFTPFAYSGGLPFVIEGSIVSTADIYPVQDDTAWEIFMDTVEIKGSNLPGLRQVLDAGMKLQSRALASVLEQSVPNYLTPKPVFRVTYLDDQMRISRDQDDKVFVYRKVSDSTQPTDYEGVMSDLGVTKLLEGFNDAITKFYI